MRTLKGGFDDDGVHEEDTDKKKKKKKKEEIEEPSEETGEIEEEIDEKFQTGGKYGDWDYVIGPQGQERADHGTGRGESRTVFQYRELGRHRQRGAQPPYPAGAQSA